MAKYRKKPVVIEAVEYRGENREEILAFTATRRGRHRFTLEGDFKCETLEGIMTAKQGDYIIKGVQGEFYPCKPDIFKETYEAVEE